jgi:hypothetical protein
MSSKIYYTLYKNKCLHEWDELSPYFTIILSTSSACYFSFAFKEFWEHLLDELYMTDRYFMTKMMYLFENRYLQETLTEIVLWVMNFHPFLLQDSSESNQRLGKITSPWELRFMVVLKVRRGKYPHSNILKTLWQDWN